MVTGIAGTKVNHPRLGDATVTATVDSTHVAITLDASPDPIIAAQYRYLAPWGYIVPRRSLQER